MSFPGRTWRGTAVGRRGAWPALLLCAGAAFAAPQPHPAATFHAAPKPLAEDAVTADWPHLLGPAFNMTSPETRLLRDLAAAPPRLAWELAKGDSYAAPVIAGDRLVLFHRRGDEAVVECLHPADGRRYWRTAFPTAYRDRYGYHGGPRCGPAIAGETAVVLGADGLLACLDLPTGRVRWQRRLAEDFALKQNFFGVGASPLIEDGKVIVQVGADGGPCVAAFDLATGRMAWGAGQSWGQSYAAPVPADLAGRRRVLVFAGGESDPPSGGLLVIDPADGRIESRFPWRGKRYESVNASPPLVLGDRVFIGECYGAGGVLLDLSAEGACRPAWTNRDFGTHFMVPVRRGDGLYGIDGHGPGDARLACVNLADGRTRWRTNPVWTNRIETAEGPREMRSGLYRGWLMPVDGRCLALGELGDLCWIELDPDGCRIASRASLFFARDTWSPPVLSRGLLYVCQNRPDMLTGAPPRLLCFDLRAAD